MSYLSDKSTLYLFSKKYRLELKNKKLYIYLEEEKIDEIPFFRLTGLVLNYHIPISAKILQYTFTHNITVCFVDGNFRFVGSVRHPESKNIFLRKAQYRTVDDAQKSLGITKEIVKAKITNQAKVIHLRQTEFALQIDAIEEADNIDSIRGVEGAFANMYWKKFGEGIKAAEFSWKGRNKYPARDEVNALLSWGYTLLGIELQTFQEIVGLDPYLGVYHRDYYGRPSLVCDMQEEFRAWVVDAFVLKLLNLRIIRKEHFKEQNGEMRLKGEGYQIFMSRWLDHIKKDKKNYLGFKEPISIRSVIEYQVRMMSKDMLNEKKFKGYIV